MDVLPSEPTDSRADDAATAARGTSTGAGTTHLLAVATGVTFGLLFWSYYRAVTTKFPVDFFSPVYTTMLLIGLVPGVYAGLRTGKRHPTVEAIFAGGLVLFLVGALWFKDQSLHYLLLGKYYDYPAPTDFSSTAGLILATLLSPLPLFLASRRLLPKLSQPGLPSLLCIGLGLGLAGAEGLIPVVGAYSVLIASVAAASFLVDDLRIAAAAAITSIVLGISLYHPPKALFLWQLNEHTHLEEQWTSLYKLDFVEFNDGGCLGSIRNEIMIEYACADPELLPMTHIEMTRALTDGPIPKRRILTLSRPAGVLPAAHKAFNPNLERAVSVEPDAQLNEPIRGRYADRVGHIFSTSPEIELITEDNRLFLERTDETFDLVYIDGIGLMLVPFPMTVIQFENYVFSSNAYQRIFDDLLTDDGILVVDRGTTRTDEANDLGGSVPEGVHVRSVFTKIPNYPLTGLSLVFVLASRNAEELDRVVARLTQGGMYAPSQFLESSRVEHRIDDNRPFYQPGAIFGMYLVMTPFTLLLLIWAGFQWRKHGSELPAGQRRANAWIGLGVIASLILLTSHGARSFSAGPNAGFVWTAAIWLLGASVVWPLARRFPVKLATMLAVLLLGSAFAVGLTHPLQLPPALLSCALGGAAAALLLGTHRSNSHPELMLRALGAATGIMLFQWIFLALGYLMLAAVLTVSLAGALAVSLRSTPTDTKVAG